VGAAPQWYRCSVPVERPTAAVLLIGDELLSGKIRDANGWFLAQRMRARGIQLVEICTVRDDDAVIGDALMRLLSISPLVFTSGGVGPTHDDRTLHAIAAATGRPLERNEALAQTLRDYYGDRISEAALTMADLPRGTQLRALPGWPVLRLDLDAESASSEASASSSPRTGRRVYILPGVPPLLRAKVATLESTPGELPEGPAFALVTVHLSVDESALAPHLDAVVSECQDVAIGSYPRWSRADDGARVVTVVVTFDADDEARGMAAREALVARLPPGSVLDAPPADPEAPGLAG
jgi:molybdenum cofactor synthesis domain-containing protein